MTRFDQGWRAAGALFPITSLPTPYGVGDLGPSASKFAKFIKGAGLSFWQILPLGPTAPSLGNSPYSGFSAFAGNELLVSPDIMLEEGLLTERDIQSARPKSQGGVNYPEAITIKGFLVDKAFQRAQGRLPGDIEFGSFCSFNAIWLNDYAFFMAARKKFKDSPWTSWPNELKYREDHALKSYGSSLAQDILRVKFGQFLFFKHLSILKKYLKELGVALTGDAPFYVNHDSADVWSNRSLFCLDHNGETALMAGVPPDYYSKTGQLWGNPVYDWPRHRESDYGWWRSRILHNLGLFDWVRLDHFRAFLASWTVRSGEETAERGSWRKGPGEELFQNLNLSRPYNILAEDLGIITPDVTDLRKALELPGTRIMQFGLGDPTGLSLHCPFRIEPDNAVYSSSHDSDTARGWWKNELTEKTKTYLSKTVGYEVTESNVSLTLIREAWFSPAAISFTTIQDLLSMGSEARINIPGTPEGNWTFRLKSFDLLTEELADKLGELTALAGRDNYPHPNILTY
jgi:4-alpha-glucanotransferase